MHSEINTEIDVEIEYQGVKLNLQMVPVTGSLDWGPATYWEPSWSEADLHISMTPDEVQDWVVEMLTDYSPDKPVPPWAYTDGQVILDMMKERIESHIDLG